MRKMVVSGVSIVAVVSLAVIASIRVQQQALARPEKAPAIAVIPFDNAGTKDAQAFADAMTEEITSRLSSLRGLRVIGRQSAKGYAGSAKTPRQIAAELGVKYVLTGTVRWDKSRDGKDLIRVSPTLLRAEDGRELWSEAYQTVMSGIFDVQAKIATEVANVLNVPLLTAERAALKKRPTDNFRAYGFYMHGNELMRNSISPAAIRAAIASFERATTLDRMFTLAWSRLAVAHTEYFWFGNDRTPGRLRLASSALQHAADIDPASPDVHVARGIFLYHGQRDYAGALREFAIAEKVRPNDYSIHGYKAGITRRQGKWQEALNSYQRALELEPRNGRVALEIGNTYLFLGRYAEAEQYADRGILISPGESRGAELKCNLAIDARGNVAEAIEHLRGAIGKVTPPSDVTVLLQNVTWPAVQDPSLRTLLIDARPSPEIPAGNFYSGKARLYLYLNDRSRSRAYADSAIRVLRAEVRENPDSATAYLDLAVAQAVRGKRDDALQSYHRSEELLPAERDEYMHSIRANLLASIYARLGDWDAAVATLEKRVDVPGGISRERVRLDPVFAPLRGNRRFERLITTS